MRWHHGFRNGLTQPRIGRISRPPGRGRLRPRLEQFEDRTLLASYMAASVSDLINDIKAANTAGRSNTITLTAPAASPYVLTAVDNSTDGPTGLPVITKGNTLTIAGNDDTIERSTASGTPDFRLFDVASGASLTLQNMALQNGLAFGSGSSAEGGAVYSQGTLTLSGVIVQGCLALGANGLPATSVKQSGSNGQDGAGGGIWSNRSLTVENNTLIQNNSAQGGTGGSAYNANYGTGPITSHGGSGGNAFGAGVYIAGGTANLSGGTVSGNNALPGQGGSAAGTYNGAPAPNGGGPGTSFGGGLGAGAGTVEISAVSVDNNAAAGSGDNGDGGGLYVAGAGLTVSSATFQSNTADFQGGGLYIADSTATLTGDTVASNTAFVQGGGLFIDSGSTATLTGNTVNSNSAVNSNGGGGMIIDGATATLSGNLVDLNGGGIYYHGG
jgi:hypothetical protein